MDANKLNEMNFIIEEELRNLENLKELHLDAEAEEAEIQISIYLQEAKIIESVYDFLRKNIPLVYEEKNFIYEGVKFWFDNERIKLKQNGLWILPCYSNEYLFISYDNLKKIQRDTN
jgi:hypothetical protein